MRLSLPEIFFSHLVLLHLRLARQKAIACMSASLRSQNSLRHSQSSTEVLAPQLPCLGLCVLCAEHSSGVLKLCGCLDEFLGHIDEFRRSWGCSGGRFTRMAALSCLIAVPQPCSSRSFETGGRRDTREVMSLLCFFSNSHWRLRSHSHN